MACAARPPLARHDHMARMCVGGLQARSAWSMVEGAGGESNPQRVRPGQRLDRDGFEGLTKESKLPMPKSPRGGARGPAEARLARGSPGANAVEEPLPPGAKGADFKTLQAMIAKGIHDSEEDSVLMEASLGGREWGRREETEEAEWRQRQQQKREAETAAREKERERAREMRRCQDEERRRRQEDELERELLEERCRETQVVEEQERQNSLCRREIDAANYIQAHFRGWQSRAGRPVECSLR